MPGFLFSTNMGGVSNYGVHGMTVVPYTVGVAGEVACLLRARALLQPGAQAGARAVRTVLLVTSGAIAVNLLSTYPYKSSDLWAAVHSWSGIALAIVELAGAAVLARGTADRTVRAAFVLVCVGFLLLFLTYIGILFILFVAEVLTAASFGFVLVRAVGLVGGSGNALPVG